MKKVCLSLMIVLGANNAFAGMALNQITELLSGSKVTGLQRIEGAAIEEVSVKKTGEDQNASVYSIDVTYFPQLTAEELKNEEGPGICVAKIKVTSPKFCNRSIFGCENDVNVISNNCFQ